MDLGIVVFAGSVGPTPQELGRAVAATTRLRLGTAVCLVPQRDPIITAKQVASLDRLRGGRLEFGAGWNREELADHGTDPRTRMRVLVERVQAMRAIWTNDEARYHGSFVDFDALWSWPKPVPRRRAADAGRSDLLVTVFGVPHDRQLLDAFAAVGINRRLLPIVADGKDGTLAALDRIAPLRRQ